MRFRKPGKIDGNLWYLGTEESGVVFTLVGMVPYFKRNYSAIEVLASEAAIKTLQKPRAIELINSYNRLSTGERV